MINVRELLRLSSVPRIGPQKIRALIAHFKTPNDVFRASARELIAVPGIDKKLASNILHYTTEEKFADEQLKRLNKLGGRILTLWDKEYPDLLRKIYDPPAFFFILGKIKETDSRSLALVGTRHPTPYGHSVAESLTREISQHSITVVSGLARGVDTIVHSTALKYGSRTIAVIGSGLDVPYPPENKKLMERISEEGAVISEFPMGTQPDAPNFPRRNRIISGLSLGTIVVESAEDGGALITATTALDQDREVFAVPGNITEKRSSGPNKLIREGRAKLITNAQDIFDELASQLHLSFDQNDIKLQVDLTPTEQSLFQFLSNEPIHIDLLSERTEMSTSDTLVTLLSLEFKGIVRQLPGKLFVRS
ncbi:MAG: DNA-processing protein DprA [Bacteroidota bacterium]